MSSRTPRTRIRRLTAAAASAALVLAAAASVAAPATAAPRDTTAPAASPTPERSATYSAGRYLVSFVEEPAATYEGTVAGYPRTRPDPGTKLDSSKAEVVRYRARLAKSHDAALASVGATKLYDYSVVTNGVAVDLSGGQATKLAGTPGVAFLEKDAIRTPDTTRSPAFLGLTDKGGLWDQLGGDKKAGRGVIVGVIDSGIWPESESFLGSRRYIKADGTKDNANKALVGLRGPWEGTCQTGQAFATSDCNDKLIGARYYVDGFGATNIAANEYLSPRDGEGHGSHTASTAAGNQVKNVVIDGVGYGTASGMAPGAMVAAYKVCWAAKPGASAGCFNSDSVAAINDAVADGVDVINYSVGGSSEASPLSAVELAYLRAARAGVFVANSAGNSGPGASTLDHPSPWLTTVAASTFRTSENVVELGDGQRFVGASLTPTLPTLTSLVRSTSVALASADPTQARLCYPGTLDPAKATGKIVQCDRGVIARIDKSFSVKNAGGVGMVLTNTSVSSLNSDLHAVPSVHVSEVARTPILAYIASAGAAATAKIVPVNPGESTLQVPEVAAFSSRGPSTTTAGDVLKPDISAPGVDVIAAVAPPFNNGRSFDAYSGTSMSSPHIAGLGALIKAAHPTWSPMMIKSALMTTARDHATSADPFAQGAGFVVPNKAVDPGLVFDAGYADWLKFLAGLFPAALPAGYPSIDGSDLNQASVAVGALAGAQRVTRTVTSVGSASETYSVSSAVNGLSVSASPSTFTLAPGASQVVQLTLTRTSGALNTWAKGSITFTGSNNHVVRIPVAARPVAISVPAETAGSGVSGSTTFSVTPGSTGTLTSTVTGLAGATPVGGSVTAGDLTFSDSPSTKVYTLTVPAGTALARFDVDATNNGDDLDLFVFRNGSFVAQSASASGDERVTLTNPAAGTYTVLVNGYETGFGGAFTYTGWAVPAGAAGNLTVSPSPVATTTGTPLDLTATWTGLDPAQRYLGYISYSGAADTTVVTIG